MSKEIKLSEEIKKELREDFYEADGKYGYGLVWREDNKFASMEDIERWIESFIFQELVEARKEQKQEILERVEKEMKRFIKPEHNDYFLVKKIKQIINNH